jgi:DNA-binding transcriptional LysR family regulator
MLLNLNQLRIFYLAAREGSFARAAELLYITPPAVTHGIKGLEAYHGVNLFRKAGRGVVLTPEGEILYESARPIFEAADQFEQTLAELGKAGRYELRVAASKQFARYLMSTITAFEERHPLVRVGLRDATSQEAVRSVETHANHLAIVGRREYPAGLQVRHLRHVDFVMATGPRNSLVGRADVSWRDLEGQPVIFREPGSSAGLALKERLAEYGVTPVVALEAGALDFMKQYAAERGALAFISREDLTNELASGRLVEIPLREGPLTLEMDIVHLPDADRSPAVRAFMDMLEESTHEDWSGLTEATPSKAPRRPKGPS